MNVLPGNLVPNTEKYCLERVYLASVDAAVHVVPFADDGRSFYVIVGHVHTSCVGNLSVDDNDFAVVAGEHMVDPWEAQGIELIDLYTLGAQFLDVMFLQWLVVGGIAEGIV